VEELPSLCFCPQVLRGSVPRTSVGSGAMDRTPAETHPVAGLQRQSVSSGRGAGARPAGRGAGARPAGRCLVHQVSQD